MSTPRKFGPYSVARAAKSLVFVSGQVGVDPATGTASPDAATQTAQAIKNVAAALQPEGLTLADVVDTTIFITSMDDFAVMNDVYAAQFSEPYPTRACVAVSELPRVVGNVPLKVEIKATAMRRT